MTRPLAVAFALTCLAACTTGPAPAEPPAGEPAAERELAEVLSVDLVRVQGSPERLRVTVRGTAPTPGYSKIRLRAVQYIQAPPDGVYDYMLVGTPPDRIVPAVLAPITITETWPLGAELKGVRVHAQGSSVLTRVPGR